MPNIRAVVLDFDGTIKETYRKKGEAFADAFADFPAHRNQIVNFHLVHGFITRRPKIERIAREVLGRAPTAAEIDARVATYGHASRRVALEAPFVRGFHRVIQEHAGRVVFAVSSHADPVDIADALRPSGFLDAFSAIHGFPVAKGEALARVIAAHGLSPDEVLFVGDVEGDHHAGLAAGVRFLFRAHGDAVIPADLPRENLIPDLMDLLPALEPENAPDSWRPGGILDLTAPLHVGAPMYPTDPPYGETAFKTLAAQGSNVTTLSLGTHAGTHVDAPRHVLAEGAPLGAFPPEHFEGRCRVVRSEGETLAPGRLDRLPSDVEFLLFDTGWRRIAARAGQDYFRAGPRVPETLLPEFDRFTRLKGVGFDLPTIDPRGARHAHRYFLSRGVLVYENLANLSRARESGDYFFQAFPLPLRDLDGAPLRAVLRRAAPPAAVSSSP
ncbi:MAG: cyclase family protein [Planctomycetes bacterium]|nr:cyclase family protein [Planctomycetota bacterium]